MTTTTKNRVTYVKALRIARKQYEVGCEYEDGTYQIDGTYEDGVKAENRAKRLAEICACDYGLDF